MLGKESETNKTTSWLYYKYHDTPDGQDCFKKTFVLSKYAAIGGVGLSLFDILYISHPQGYVAALGRISFWTGQFAGMAALFAASTCAATNIRGKDDVWNYAIGGGLAGSVVGTAWKNPRIGLGWSIVLACAGMFHKAVLLEGGRYMTPENITRDFGEARKHDFTLRKDVDIPKDWW